MSAANSRHPHEIHAAPIFRKSWLRYLTACRDCRGEECQNAAPVAVQPDEDEIPEYTR